MIYIYIYILGISCSCSIKSMVGVKVFLYVVIETSVLGNVVARVYRGGVSGVSGNPF